MAKRKRRTKAEIEAANKAPVIESEIKPIKTPKDNRPASKIIDICRRSFMYDKRITVDVNEEEYEDLSKDISIFTGIPRKSIDKSAIIGIYIYKQPIRVILEDRDT